VLAVLGMYEWHMKSDRCVVAGACAMPTTLTWQREGMLGGEPSYAPKAPQADWLPADDFQAAQRVCEALFELAEPNFRHKLLSPVVHAIIGDDHADLFQKRAARQELADTSDLLVLRGGRLHVTSMLSHAHAGKSCARHQSQGQQPSCCATLLVAAQQSPALSRACLS